jgi:hypothetical protein
MAKSVALRILEVVSAQPAPIVAAIGAAAVPVEDEVPF